MIVNKKYIFLIIIGLFFSCSKREKIIEKYNNKTIKAIYYKKDGILDGLYKEFYEDGNIKTEHIFRKGKKIDSSVFYFPNDVERKRVIYYSDSLDFNTYYDKNNSILSQGYTFNSNINFRVGKWAFLKKEIDSIVEYINVNNEPYVNQVWILNKEKDTIYNRGNFFEIYMKDSILINELVHIRCYLRLPYYDYDSEMEVIIPKNVNELCHDYSNWDEIEKDTLYSLKNDRIPHRNIPSEVPKNHFADFGFIYEKPGKKEIKGAIVEYLNYGRNDSVIKYNRKLFFEREVYVKEAVFQN